MIIVPSNLSLLFKFQCIFNKLKKNCRVGTIVALDLDIGDDSERRFTYEKIPYFQRGWDEIARHDALRGDPHDYPKRDRGPKFPNLSGGKNIYVSQEKWEGRIPMNQGE